MYKYTIQLTAHVSGRKQLEKNVSWMGTSTNTGRAGCCSRHLTCLTPRSPGDAALAELDGQRRIDRRVMCPMRFWLLFFSGIVAGYLAWTSMFFRGEAAAGRLGGEGVERVEGESPEECGGGGAKTRKKTKMVRSRIPHTPLSLPLCCACALSLRRDARRRRRTKL